MFYKFFCIFDRKAKISKKLIFDKPEVPMTVVCYRESLYIGEPMRRTENLVTSGYWGEFDLLWFETRDTQKVSSSKIEIINVFTTGVSYLEHQNMKNNRLNWFDLDWVSYIFPFFGLLSVIPKVVPSAQIKPSNSAGEWRNMGSATGLVKSSCVCVSSHSKGTKTYLRSGYVLVNTKFTAIFWH